MDRVALPTPDRRGFQIVRVQRRQMVDELLLTPSGKHAVELVSSNPQGGRYVGADVSLRFARMVVHLHDDRAPHTVPRTDREAEVDAVLGLSRRPDQAGEVLDVVGCLGDSS